jgi:hypothetical protein
MLGMNATLHEQTIKLRLEENLSYSQIRKKLGVPKSTLSGWLKDFPLSEERIKELQREGWGKNQVKIERYRNTMREKRELKSQEVYNQQRKKLANISEDAYFVAGLMLYLGEGGKKDDSRITLANTDSRIIKFFVKWLADFFEIPKEKIRAQLHLYPNMDLNKEKKFWKDELEFAEAQFYKPYIGTLQKSSFSYRESYRHGTCSIYVMGVEKKRELMMAIKAFVDTYMIKHVKGM